MNPVSVEAFDIFSQGEISECDSCGVNSDCESGTWSSALVSNDIRVPPSFAVDVVGGGEEFGSECGSVAVSGVLCGYCCDFSFCCDCEVCLRTLSGILWNPQSFSFSKKRSFACVEDQENMNYEGLPVKGFLLALKEG